MALVVHKLEKQLNYIFPFDAQICNASVLSRILFNKLDLVKSENIASYWLLEIIIFRLL